MSYWEGYAELRGVPVYIVAQVKEVPDYWSRDCAEVEIESVEGPDLEMFDTLTRAEQSYCEEVVIDRYFAEIESDKREAS